MIRSIAMHNFVHFHEEQRLVFEEGANFLIGGNSTGKTALFELIRRCYSNKINTTTSSVLNENELAYAVCHFKIPEQYPPIERLKLHKEEHPKDILACIFIKSQGFQPKNISKGQTNGYDCYKVICSISSTGSQTFAQKFIGSYGCYTKQLDDNTKGCRRIAPDTSAIKDVKDTGTKKVIHHFFKIVENDFESTTPVQRSFPFRILSTLQSILRVILSVVIRSKYGTDAGTSDEAIMNSLYLLLEEGYVGILPMRSIGPLQWTKSELNQHKSRDKNYENADHRAEILSNLLDNDLVDKTQEQVFHDQIIHPYEFIKLGGKIEVSNTERKDLSPKRLLKTPEGILEGKQLTLILSHKEFATITIEEPDRGMHPHMIKKMRDLILNKINGKTVLIITHNPAMLDKWAMERTFVSSKSILNEIISHSICKVPKGCVKLSESEEIKNLLFSSRILFVEGKTDKIIIEAIFRLLIHEDEDKIQEDKRISTEQKHFLLATDIREMSGEKNGKKMKKFCKEMKKEIYLLYDADVKQKPSNNDEEFTFSWKNGDLEQRFIDILDNCNDTTVINAVTEIFRKKTAAETDKKSIEEYLDYQKELKKLTVKIEDTDTEIAENNETSVLAEFENKDKEKTELERKIKVVQTTIKAIVKRFIPLTDSTDIEMIATAMIHHSKEVEQFIDKLLTFAAKKS